MKSTAIIALALSLTSPATASLASEAESQPIEVKPVVQTHTAKMTAKPPARITVAQTVLPLPGGLNDTPVFMSNSPEIVLKSGILASTFPGQDKAHPEAHLNTSLSGRFDVFFHHITNATKSESKRTMYLGMLIGNASSSKVHVKVLEACSHATKPDAPFKDLNAVLDNEQGSVYAGPGDRVMLELLRDHKQHGWHSELSLEPGETKIVYALPLHVKSLLHPLNGRTGVLRLDSDGPVYVASLSAFGERKLFGEHAPKLQTWNDVLQSKSLVDPRDKVPSVPGAGGQLIYGRVAGIAKGSTWTATLTNDEKKERLSIGPQQIISFPINTLAAGTLGTNQVQAAPMTVRYPDTAYQSHGNYGMLYNLLVPLYNDSDADLTAGLSFQTPLKDWNKTDSLQFFSQIADQVFFRGTIKFEWTDEFGKERQKYVHLVEKRGQSLSPQIEFLIKPHSIQNVRFKLLYPADCTPPHVLTITTVTRPQ